MNNKMKFISCGMAIFWGGAVSFGYPGVMTTYWKAQFAAGDSQTGLVVTFMLVALAISMFFSGKIYEIIGLARCFVIGTVLYICAFTIALFASSIYWIYVWGLLANFALSFIYGPSLTTCQNVQPEKRGTVNGIMNLVFGISAAIMSPVMNHILETLGYAALNIIMLAAITCTNTAALFLLKKYNKNEIAAADSICGEETNYSVTEALKTKEFWLMWLIWAFMGAAGISMISISKTYASLIGITGVIMLTTFNLANGGIRIFAGIMIDKIGGCRTGFLFFALSALAYFLLGLTEQHFVVCLCTALVGMAFGTLFTISGPILTGMFGTKNFGKIYGLVFTGYGIVGGIAGPAIVGRILDGTGMNYLFVFLYLGAASVLGTVLIFVTERFVRRRQRRS